VPGTASLFDSPSICYVQCYILVSKERTCSCNTARYVKHEIDALLNAPLGSAYGLHG
jgi:hypothetical protein